MANVRIKHYHAFVVPVLLSIAGLTMLALPTTENHGAYFGGGPLRQWTLNHFLLPALPDNIAHSALVLFNHGDVIDEWLLCAPVIVVLFIGTTPLFQLLLNAVKKSFHL